MSGPGEERRCYPWRSGRLRFRFLILVLHDLAFPDVATDEDLDRGGEGDGKEGAELAKGVVKREVVRVMTPGGGKSYEILAVMYK